MTPKKKGSKNDANPMAWGNAVDLNFSRSIYSINPKHEIRNPKQIQNANVQNSKQKQHDTMLSSFFRFDHLNMFRISIFEFRI
jgi:hypothetical protein